jgi:hypothetical protein
MSTNKETGDYLHAFTVKEDALRKRAKAAELDLTDEPWNDWGLWFGDPVRYLYELRVAVEAVEKRDHITEGEIATGTQ